MLKVQKIPATEYPIPSGGPRTRGVMGSIVIAQKPSPAADTECLVTFVASKKSVHKRATKRNLAKRRCWEAFRRGAQTAFEKRETVQDPTQYRFIIHLKNNAIELPFDSLKLEFEKVFFRLWNSSK